MLSFKKISVSLMSLAIVMVGTEGKTTFSIGEASDFIQQKRAEIAQAEKLMNQLGIEKGHDENVNQVLVRAAPKIDEAKAKLKALEEQKSQFDKLAAELNKTAKSLSREITNALTIATSSLTAAQNLIVRDPKNYPEKCLVMKLNDPVGEGKIQKAGLTRENGIIEQFNRIWVLSIGDEKVPGALRRIPLDEKVGLIGSSDPNSGMLVRGLTPKDMVVTGLVDPKTNKVMCVSQARKIH